MTWYVAACDPYDVTPLGLLLRDGWEPFAVDRQTMYLRTERDTDPVAPPGAAAAGWVQITPYQGQGFPRG